MNRIEILQQYGFVLDPQTGNMDLSDLTIEAIYIKDATDADFTAYIDQLKEFIEANPEYKVAPQTKEPTIIDKALITLQSGSEVLNKNKFSAANAELAARKLLDKIKANGMTQPIYEEIMSLLKKTGVTVKAMNEARKPFTQAMDLIRDEFTSCENGLKEATNGSLPAELKLYADDYAKQVAAEKKRQDEAIAAQARKNQEIIDLKAKIEKALMVYFNDWLTAQKTRFNNKFNAITLDTYEAEFNFFTTVKPSYAKEHFLKFICDCITQNVTKDEFAALISEIANEGKYNELDTAYKAAFHDLKYEKIDLLHSKKLELIRIKEFEEEQEKERLENLRREEERKNADAARKQELDRQQAIADQEAADRREKQRISDEERKQREEKEAAAIAEENRKAQEAAALKVDATASHASTVNLFEQQVQSASIALPELKVKTGYDLEVLKHTAWLKVINYWYQIEGVGKDDEWMRKKFDFMTKAIEKHAMAKGEKLEDADIVYHETVKSKV